jgi:hypothetical protein
MTWNRCSGKAMGKAWPGSPQGHQPGNSRNPFVQAICGLSVAEALLIKSLELCQSYPSPLPWASKGGIKSSNLQIMKSISLTTSPQAQRLPKSHCIALNWLKGALNVVEIVLCQSNPYFCSFLYFQWYSCNI